MLVFSFSARADLRAWKVVDDRVMGGVSKSSIALDDAGRGVFSGVVSLQNGGGFSSVKYDSGPIEVDQFDRIKIRLKGDGKRYQFRLKSDLNDAYAYIKIFQTSGSWQDLNIPLSGFEPRYRGKPLDLPNFNKSKIEQFAFLIANKSEEHFKLIIDRIELVE